MRSGFAMGDVDGEKAGPAPEQAEGRIILPGAASPGSARPADGREASEEGIIVSPRSLIEKP